MRPPRAFLLLPVLAACAAASPPPPAADPPPAASSAPEVAPAAPVASATPTAEPSLAPEAPAPSATPSAPPTQSVVEEALPPASAEQRAFVTGQLLGTEVVFMTVADATATCASVASKDAPLKGTRRFDLRVLWQTGYYAFENRMAQGKLGTYQGTFWLKEDATQGGVQVRAAPLEKGATGRVHIKASRPGSAQSVDAELDVTLCAAVDFTRKGKK